MSSKIEIQEKYAIQALQDQIKKSKDRHDPSYSTELTDFDRVEGVHICRDHAESLLSLIDRLEKSQ